MTMTLADWLADVNGKAIDVDGRGGAQCWDLVQDYLTRCLGGGSLQTGPSAHQGYAIGCWDGFSQNGLSQWFSQADASQTMLAGWVPIWKWGSVTAPLSHIAVGTVDNGLTVSAMSQNPGNAHITTLPKIGLAGYLVPKNPAANNSANLAGFTTVSNNPVDTVTAAVNSVESLANAWDKFQSTIKWFSDSGNWTRIGLYITGGIILLIAVSLVLKSNPTTSGIIDTATDTAKGAINHAG